MIRLRVRCVWGILLGALLLPTWTAAQERSSTRERYSKREVRIPMRDGANLFTAIYTPRDASATHTYPILMVRTCYSVGPYGKENYPFQLHANRDLERSGYIFVFQDVRGCYMSEGTFVNMTPHIDNKRGPQDIDESSDTYDTIAWLLANVPCNNGRVGQWGISYPGFYAAAGMIDAHPALKAVSPQAPIADWWYDDFHHHGAFFLPHAFNFLIQFGQPRPVPTTFSAPRFRHDTPDGYEFFLNMGSLKNADARYLRDRVTFWTDIVKHPNYDAFWQARNLLPHLQHVAPAVLVVGGWFDAEDLYGALQIYRQVERLNPQSRNAVVMGPWAHGGWARSRGDRLGNVGFGSPTAEFYRRRLEYEFFEANLKGTAPPTLAEASMFETGGNRWRMFDQWPPSGTESRSYYFLNQGRLGLEAPQDQDAYDEFVSDPRHPVPFTEKIATGMTREYMTDDQRFAARRPDVLTWQTEPLTEDIVIAGPVTADLRVSTSQSDADWVVKLVDVYPPDAPDDEYMEAGRTLAGYQMLVRSEVVRGRFRNDPSQPEPFVPGQVTTVRFDLQDVLHRFRQGHRLMIQVQSTWFPLVDRNPQKYVDNIYVANDLDFVSAVHRVYRSANQPSHIEFAVLPDGPGGEQGARGGSVRRRPRRN